MGALTAKYIINKDDHDDHDYNSNNQAWSDGRPVTRVSKTRRQELWRTREREPIRGNANAPDQRAWIFLTITKQIITYILTSISNSSLPQQLYLATHVDNINKLNGTTQIKAKLPL